MAPSSPPLLLALLLSLLPARAHPPATLGWAGLPSDIDAWHVEVRGDVAVMVVSLRPGSAGLDPDTLDRLLESAAGQPEARGRHLQVEQRSAGGAVLPAGRLQLPPVPEKEPWAASLAPVQPRLPALRTSPHVRSDRSPPPSAADLPGGGEGALEGKAVYISQCHGWIWFDTLDDFSTQRGNLYDTVEDMHNPEGADQFLIPMLENMGARVYTAKERDLNPLMAIADNDGDGYDEEGSGFVDGPDGFLDRGGWDYGESPFAAGSTRRFPDGTGAVARWIPEIPADGTYAVYLSWDSAADQSPRAHYRITHPGGVIDRTFDQRVHGSTWQYAETLYLPAGVGGLVVELVGDGDSGDWLSADAVRVGGGITDVSRFGDNPDRPRWEDGAVQYTQFNGAPTSVYDPYDDGNGSDPSARSRWASWERPSGEDAVYLSWHSNAGGGRGTSTYTYDGDYGPAVDGSEELSSFVHEEIIEGLRALQLSSWTDRGTPTAAFAETSPAHNDEFPSILVELAFHDEANDAAYLKEPGFRLDASRAMARGIAHYFADSDGVDVVFPPEAPVGLSLLHEGGELVARWEAGPEGAPYGDRATAWRLYTSDDGRSWDNGADLSVPEAILDVAPGRAVYVRATALNAGGESFPTEVIGARRMPEGTPPVLIVAAFDRFQASQLGWEDLPRVGEIRRMWLPRLNPFDTVAVHGRATVGAGFYMDSLSDEALDRIELGAYPLVIWAAGEESTLDEAISDAQQEILRAYIEGGGKLVLSGAEALWDLDELGSDADHAFLDEVLGVRIEADDAETELVSGEGPLAGLSADFSPAASGCYPVEWPDVLASAHPVIARYATGGAAGVSDGQITHFGFPLECAGDEADRIAWFSALLPHLLPDWVAPEVADDGGGDDGGDGSTDGSADGGGGSGTADDAGAGGEDDAEDGGEVPGKGVGFGGCAHAPGSQPTPRIALLLGLLALPFLGRRRRHP